MPQRIEVPGIGVVEFPDGMTDAQIAAAIQRNMPGQKAREESSPVAGALKNLAGGLVRGAGSIGATLLTPYDMLAGNTQSIGNPERRKAMDGGLQALGVDTDSWAFSGGKLAGEIAGTAGVGGAMARGLSTLPGAARAAPLLDAVKTGGFSAGGLTGRAGLGVRTAGGAAAGAVGAGAVNPEDAGFGAAVGGALPGLLLGAKATGNTVAGAFRSPQKKAAAALLERLEQDPATVVQQLQAAKTLVPGSNPTVAQVLRTPQASAIESIVSDTPGGGLLKARYAEQNAARLAALDSVAPTDPRGMRSAQQDFGASALSAIRAGDKAAKAETSAAYGAVKQDAPSLYLPDLRTVADELFPRGSFGNRASVDAALRAADEIGFMQVPGIKAARPAQAGETLAQAVRKAGGISVTNNAGLRGEVSALRGDLKNLVRVNGGLSPDRMAERMREAGYIADESADTLFAALRDEANGGSAYSVNATPERAWAAARDAAMGEPPGAQSVAQKVTLREFDALRKSIGREARAAAINPERATEALALNRMKGALDARIDEVLEGGGAADEFLPLETAYLLSKAQKLKREQVQTYRTGPQALAFKQGSDGMPLVQDGEFAAKVWGNRPGVAADIRQFKSAIERHPQLLERFKSLITTEGAGTATQSGALTGKFVKWVDNSLPGMKEVFSPAEVKTFQRIAADIKRSEMAFAAGASRNSATYRNASGALSLGLLDNPLVGVAANRIPLLNQFAGPLLQALKDSGRKSQAQELAGLLSDPAAAAGAMGGLLNPAFPRLEAGGNYVARGLLLGAPGATAD